jgi:hypothetical protein
MGFWNRRFWMWVLVVPAVILGTLAVIGDTFWETARFWWLSAPLLLGLAALIWRGLDPAKPEAGENSPPAPPKRQGPGAILVKLLATLVLLALSIVALGVVVALASWAREMWYVTGPVFVAFVVLIFLALRPDKPKATPIVRGPSGERDRGDIVR